MSRKTGIRVGGRPPKFGEPSRPVTTTLPDRTLEQLYRIDVDRAKAIVKTVDWLVEGRAGGRTPRGIDLVEIAPGTSILVVPPNRSLRTLPWLRMIEVAPTRYLLAIVPGTPIERVEVALIDLVENARSSGSDELELLDSLRETIGALRRGGKISKAEILVFARERGASK